MDALSRCAELDLPIHGVTAIPGGVTLRGIKPDDPRLDSLRADFTIRGAGEYVLVLPKDAA